MWKGADEGVLLLQAELCDFIVNTFITAIAPLLHCCTLHRTALSHGNKRLE